MKLAHHVSQCVCVCWSVTRVSVRAVVVQPGMEVVAGRTAEVVIAPAPTTVVAPHAPPNPARHPQVGATADPAVPGRHGPAVGRDVAGARGQASGGGVCRGRGHVTRWRDDAVPSERNAAVGHDREVGDGRQTTTTASRPAAPTAAQCPSVRGHAAPGGVPAPAHPRGRDPAARRGGAVGPRWQTGVVAQRRRDRVRRNVNEEEQRCSLCELVTLMLIEC